METLEGDYEPSPWAWVREQIATYEASAGARANMLGDSDWPIVVVTYRGRRTAKVRKVALMRVEHDGVYALIGSMGGAPTHPQWVHSLRASPTEVLVQDGSAPFRVTVREAEGDERATWWARAVEAYPPYDDYQKRCDRLIPVFVATPAGEP